MKIYPAYARHVVCCLVLIVAPWGSNAAAQQPLLHDGFEGGSTCGWSSQVGGAAPFMDTFSAADGSPWPTPWTAVGGVALADVQSGQARFRPIPSGYSLARLVAPIDTRDVELRATLVFEDIDTQGIGLYVRQNGGYLDDTVPTGEGYAVFVEGFRANQGIGVWREVDGDEIPVEITFDNGLGLQNGVPYRVRFRATQMSATTTLLQAKIWTVGESEPEAWNVSATDSTPGLQNLSGGIALDSWSSFQSPNSITAHTLVDDVEVEELCNPLASVGSATAVSESFLFTEGPLWAGDHLLLSDIDGDTIYRHDPPGLLGVFRTPSDRANGLAFSIEGELLAAEHQSRRVSRTDSGGVVHALVDTYTGLRFNSPNDLAVRSDGTLYFTDPSYGLADPGDRELAFNGVFRRQPDGTLSAPWEGVVATNEPNGVALSPDEELLYVTDTEAGELLVFDVATDGSLSNRRTLVEGLTIPDGLCVDVRGNVYVATWASTVEVFTADGVPWGSIPIPRQATNCAFGGADGRTLYVTAQEGLYELPMPLPGRALAGGP